MPDIYTQDCVESMFQSHRQNGGKRTAESQATDEVPIPKTQCTRHISGPITSSELSLGTARMVNVDHRHDRATSHAIYSYARITERLELLSSMSYHPTTSTTYHREALLSIPSTQRATYLLPFILAASALWSGQRIVDEDGVPITTAKVVRSVANWRAIVRRAMEESCNAADALDEDEWSLYTQFGYEVDICPGVACREITRKAAEPPLSHNRWGTYGWEWVRTMVFRRSIMGTDNDNGDYVRPMLSPPCRFPASFASLPPEIYRMIGRYLTNLFDLVSLRSTNTFFRHAIRRPRAEDLEYHRIDHMGDPWCWRVCNGCNRLLHIRCFDASPHVVLQLQEIPLCLECGTRPLPRSTDLYQLRMVNNEGYYVHPHHGRCKLYFGAGYRWKDMDGAMWLRCATCLYDDRDHGAPVDVCEQCYPGVALGRQLIQCRSCILFLPHTSFDHTRDLADPRPVCLTCGSRDLPPCLTLCPRASQATLYFVSDYESTRWDVQGGFRFGLNYVWTDANLESFKRCRSCRKGSKVTELSIYGNCPVCHRLFDHNTAIPPLWKEAYTPWRWCVSCVHCGKSGRVRAGVTLTHCDRSECFQHKVEALDLALGGVRDEELNAVDGASAQTFSHPETPPSASTVQSGTSEVSLSTGTVDLRWY